MRLALLATIVTFAGSIAGFHLAYADGTPGGDVRADPPAGTEQPLHDGDCPAARRRWEEA
jgi:hypothetical protein